MSTLPPELEVAPVAGPLDATVAVPGSKSVTNRALAVAAVADGRSVLRGALLADDTEAMLGCLRALGVAVRVDDTDPDRPVVEVDGVAGALPPATGTPLDARMSGTTARFVAPLLAAAGSGTYRLDGHPQLRRRPMVETAAALRALGATVDGDLLPLDVTGGMAGGAVALDGTRSSQFLSGLLLAGPLLDEGLDATVTGTLVSRPYLELTASVMRTFGAEVEGGDSGRRWRVAAGGYRRADLDVEPDASAASYPLAAAAVAGGRVRVVGLGRDAAQGDAAFVDVLARMGCDVEVTDHWTEVRRPPGRALQGVEVDMADISDTAQTLAVVAAVADGPTRVTGIGFIRAKETDRIGATVAELRRCGVDADEEPDGFVVRPRPGAWHGARVQTYDDHRMAMSFALLGLVVPGLVIVDPGCVAKTFPRYFDLLERLRRRP